MGARLAAGRAGTPIQGARTRKSGQFQLDVTTVGENEAWLP